MKTTVKQANARALFEAVRDEYVTSHAVDFENHGGLENLRAKADAEEARIDKIRRLAKKVNG